ncbi:GGDEF family protein [Oceanicaulis alexandrii HTCC2633]|uniref:EAL domain-containing protein n=1 Tax=Oceanicaulis sp. HTCC2633 TaxID=314254 RepID=UPI000066BBFA|nr:EAL domain-containing protein [Oceanicaulis sp. HTCC2633]EAP89004.1 GGDEF family protein [Oceanicaulis alexandrii HTCC2633] [Oceanicaulis sp. HTCC2633]
MTDPTALRPYRDAVSAAGALAVEINFLDHDLTLGGEVTALGLGALGAAGDVRHLRERLAPADQPRLDLLQRAGPCDVRLRLLGDDHEVRYVRLIGQGDGLHWRGLMLPAGGSAGGRADMDLETALADSLKSGDVCAYYQPVVDLKTKRLAGFEALARWDRPGVGVLGADEFMPLAQAHGYVEAVGESVRSMAVQDLSAWLAARNGPLDLFVTANATATEVSAPDFADRLLQAVQASGLPRGAFKLEVNETDVMVDPEAAERTLNAVRDQGVPIVLDDFGTGYSSLARLDRFAFDVVKLDQYFIRAALTDGSARSIISSVVRIAESYGMSVVAEGVESEAAQTLCLELGCDYGQGYHFAPALSPQDAARAVTQGMATRFGAAQMQERG